MRVEFIFFRWLLVIAIIALGLVYAGSSHQRQPRPAYESIRLVQGGQSAGTPLAGIVVDPNRRDVYAIVGTSSASDSAHPFYIVWKGKQGEIYGTSLPQGSAAPESLFEVSPNGQVMELHKLAPNESEQPRFANEYFAGTEALRSIIEALPSSSTLP